MSAKSAKPAQFVVAESTRVLTLNPDVAPGDLNCSIPTPAVQARGQRDEPGCCGYTRGVLHYRAGRAIAVRGRVSGWLVQNPVQLSLQPQTPAMAIGVFAL